LAYICVDLMLSSNYITLSNKLCWINYCKFSNKIV
jgi:hypothetical protein